MPKVWRWAKNGFGASKYPIMKKCNKIPYIPYVRPSGFGQFFKMAPGLIAMQSDIKSELSAVIITYNMLSRKPQDIDLLTLLKKNRNMSTYREYPRLAKECRMPKIDT